MTRTRTQGRLGADPPERTASAQRPSRVRSIFELWRRSTGSFGTVSTAATACGATAVANGAIDVTARQAGLAFLLDNHDDLPTTRRADPGHGAAQFGCELDGDLERHRCHRPVGGVDDVRHPTLDPEPAIGVEMADVTRAMPLEPLIVNGPSLVGRGPEPVVARGLPGGGDDDLPALAATVERLDPQPHAGERASDTHASTRADVRERREVDVCDRQHLGHAVGRVELGSGSKAAERLEDPLLHGCTGRENEAERAERLAPVAREGLLRREYAVERRRSGEEDGRLDRGTGIGEPIGAQGRGLRDVAIGYRNRDAERRAVERERSEGCNEPIVGADCVARADGSELRRHLSLAVEHALGRPGRARGEDDSRRRVGSGGESLDHGGELRAVLPSLATQSRDLEPSGGRCPAQEPRYAERPAGAEQPTRLCAPERSMEAT